MKTVDYQYLCLHIKFGIYDTRHITGNGCYLSKKGGRGELRTVVAY